MRADWDDGGVRLLTRLWKSGSTASEIAGVLGVSRSAVLGKIFRLRLGVAEAGASRGPAGAAAASERNLARRRRGGYVAAAPVKAGRRGKTLLELTNTCCRWPYRRPGTEKYFFCGAAGADIENGIPYCGRHMKRAYLATPPRIVRTDPPCPPSAPAKAPSAA